MSRKVRAATVGFVLVSCVASAAWSQDADALIEQGVAMRSVGQDEVALRLFQQAWEARRSGRAQAQIALAEQALGRWVEAEAHLTQALATPRDAWVRDRRRPLRAALAEIREHVGRLELRGNVPGAEVLIGAQVVATLPMAEALRVPTGAVTFTVRARGFVSVTRTVTVANTTPLREEVALAPEPEPDRSAATTAATGAVARAASAAPREGAEGPRDGSSPARRYVGIALLGAGGAALVAAGAFLLVNAGVDGAAQESTPTSADPYGAWARFQADENRGRALSGAEVCELARQRVGADAAQVRDLCASTSSSATIALVTGIAGGALAATGLVLTLTARPSPRRAARWGVTPWMARAQGGATFYMAW
jgi:tetratricopeptide (TPR) repeat protein